MSLSGYIYYMQGHICAPYYTTTPHLPSSCTNHKALCHMSGPKCAPYYIYNSSSPKQLYKPQGLV